MKTVLLIMMILTGCTALFGQGQVIEKAEFDLIQNNSAYPYVRWKGKTFRRTLTTEARQTATADPYHVSKSIQEYGIGGTRSINESRFQKDEPKSSEWIFIGDKQYVKTGNGAWKISEPSEDNPPAPPAPASGQLSTTSEYRYLGTELYRGQTVKTYSKTDTIKRVNARGAEVTSVNKTKFWYDSDGTMLKSDFQGNSNWDDKTSYTRVVMEFELDPTIKITAPEIP